MTILLRTLAFTLSLLLTSLSPSLAASSKCTECGMTVDLQSKFAAKINQGETTLLFCDIGDLFSYMKRKSLNKTAADVRDYITGEWIDARKASYVRDEIKFKSPMGWGIAAFKDKNTAAKSGPPMDFDGAVKALK